MQNHFFKSSKIRDKWKISSEMFILYKNGIDPIRFQRPNKNSFSKSIWFIFFSGAKIGRHWKVKWMKKDCWKKIKIFESISIESVLSWKTKRKKNPNEWRIICFQLCWKVPFNTFIAIVVFKQTKKKNEYRNKNRLFARAVCACDYE